MGSRDKRHHGQQPGGGLGSCVEETLMGLEVPRPLVGKTGFPGMLEIEGRYLVED